MSAIRLAYRYAKSLVDISTEKKQLEEVKNDMDLITSMVDQSPEFANLLHSPIINSDKKKNILKALLDGKTSVITTTFVDLLISKSREAYIGDIAKSFTAQYNQHKKITPVKVISAEKLSDSAIEGIKKKLVAETDIENIELTTEIDESLIGGFVLQYRDKLVDASLAHELNKFRNEFKDNEYVKKLR